MKRLSIISILALSALVAFAQKREFKIQGTVAGDLKSAIFYIYVSDDKFSYSLPVDSVIVKNGKFTYTKNLDGMRTGYMYLRGTKKDGSNIPLPTTSTYLMPGEIMTLSYGDDFSTTVGGSQFYQETERAKAVIRPFEVEMRKVLDDITAKAKEDGANREVLQRQAQEPLRKIRDGLVDAAKEYLVSHPTEEGSVALVSHLEQVPDFDKLYSETLRNGSRVAPYINYMGERMRIRAQRDREVAAARDKVKPGMDAPDFTLKDINGNDLSLSSLRGKYVVLDFWGSWCSWCIKGIPDMKKYYEKYKGKLEILGIDCNDTEDKWKDAVKKHELPWRHVYNPSNGKVPTLFAVTGYPTKIVISPEGKIAKVVVGESPDFYTYLDELFGK